MGPLRRPSLGWILDGVTQEIERLLLDVRAGRRVELAELEQAYTTGCAEVLELEAQAIRARRHLSELREQLRHVRTAIEWLQEESGARRASQ